ncbi:6-carboxytetrahydropterin synthase [Bacteriovorax sp. DB6_IX]|uniref:6-pyruvoyl trahydropterin synthase family protein n=1 Tax=Bacteriovorax sp. DB6_IX TaxID=1353530 RepID=UPI000389F34A|nr:6-carboxytetrahydropterin synthase [Bacteriovorax sp. DB6_IX]EQC43146.1 6-pyruvoyl tetrahydropterin synthase [Bacteriovorax sp. DB6_IX]
MNYAIKVYKEYFNFAASHFVIFKDGTREPLHGHNYRVALKGDALDLEGDMVFDFLDIKPIVREVCDSLDHKLLLPGDNPHLKINDDDTNWEILPQDGSRFSIPKQDVLILPLSNTSAERLAIYLANRIDELTKQRFDFQFKCMEIEVEETRGQCAIYRMEN